MEIHTFRLKPGQDLKPEIVSYVKKHDIKAGAILTCVGGLNRAVLRMADEHIINTYERNFEIVSLVGTLSQDGCHLHISLSNGEGETIGGHLKEGCSVYSTAEVVLGEFEDQVYSRIHDEETGFKELHSNPA